MNHSGKNTYLQSTPLYIFVYFLLYINASSDLKMVRENGIVQIKRYINIELMYTDVDLPVYVCFRKQYYLIKTMQ